MFAAAKVVLLQLRIVVVCRFVKIIAPAPDAMFTHDKTNDKRDIAVSEGVRQASPQIVRVGSAMKIDQAVSVLCMSLRGQHAHLQVATRSSMSGMFGGMLCSSLHKISLCIVPAMVVHCRGREPGERRPSSPTKPSVLASVWSLRF